MDVWIVGLLRGGEWPMQAWEFMGVFDDRARAIEACTLDTMFIMKARINERLPDTTIFETPDDTFYPRLQPERI